MSLSKTQQALEWMRQNPGVSCRAAALKFGLQTSTVSRAKLNAEATEDKRCPCCGQLIRK
ncbi:hypothetical protein 8G_00002 [Ralstonia phage Hyacinthe]|uniref:Uncharacterized protein n=3 Tax=Rahariannevirus raharianne TaxID=2846050 RepID=A0A7G5BBB7_9CAUD|nr:hypothetical protein KMC43_gp21 [Ralstonia phage Raharianne]QMV32396.1 hypothetical protein U2_00021 [Ralstonia phage Albius]QMV33434.1 hypothetical protein 8G_00002 [Ralstonia phage Hyacinthe]QMV33590.1 hypothetical protein Y2_00021 [Ralstonia phage Raharianne]